MGLSGGKKYLSLAGLATVIVAPLSILGWNSKDNSAQPSIQNTEDQNQQAQAPQVSQLGDLGQKAQSPSSGSTSAPAATNSSQTTVMINGQNIPLSADGQVHRVVQDGSSTTTLDISVSGNASGSVGSTSNVNSVNFSTNTEQVSDDTGGNN